MRRLLALLLLAVSLTACGTAARYARGPETSTIMARSGYDGHIDAVTYLCSEPDLTFRRMVVYLPERYYEDTLRRYPVLYLLHGARGNEVTWMDYGNAFHLLDSLRREGLARDFIVVLPNLNNYRGDKDYKNGHAMNATRAFWLLDGEAERYFHKDVVRTIDSLYRTVPERRGRAIAGMSSGALQALYLSAGHPADYDYVGLFSPYNKPTFAAWGHRDVYGRLWKRLAGQFQEPLALYAIYIGTGDFFLPHMRNFDRKLTRKGYPHRFVLAPGGHEWYNWTAFLEDFYQSIFPEEAEEGE